MEKYGYIVFIFNSIFQGGTILYQTAVVISL